MLADAGRDVIKLTGDGIAATRKVTGYSSGQLKIGALYSLTNGTAPEVIFGSKLRRPEL